MGGFCSYGLRGLHECVSMQVPCGYQLQRGPVLLHGHVTVGFGRGSRKLGTPTANLPPQPLHQELQGLPLGVYFGYAQLG